MVNYQEGKIYKLVGGGLTYYGSTCDELRKRLYQHKQKKCKSKLLYDTGDKVEIILVEKYPCNDKMELHQRERYYIENFDCVNKNIPNRKNKEYHKIWTNNNKEKIKEQKREWRKKNRELINIKLKEWRNKKKI